MSTHSLMPHERIERYAERYFQHSNCERFPTVREVARALGMRQAKVVEEIEASDSVFLTSWYVSPADPIGSHFVETWGEETDTDTNEITNTANLATTENSPADVCPDCGGRGRYERKVQVRTMAGYRAHPEEGETVECKTCVGQGEV